MVEYMKVNLRKMTLQEYDIFLEYSMSDHAREMVKENNISFEDALMQTKAEVQEMLPAGLDTRDNSLMIIEDLMNGKNVGVMWYLFEETDGVKQVFLSDFVIDENERRKGYATAALEEMNKSALEYGCEESVLFVAKDNDPAIRLYSNYGYKYFREFEDGIFMKKEL